MGLCGIQPSSLQEILSICLLLIGLGLKGYRERGEAYSPRLIPFFCFDARSLVRSSWVVPGAGPQVFVSLACLVCFAQEAGKEARWR